MSEPTNYKHREAIARGDKYKAQARVLAREVAALKKQLPKEYERGSTETFGMVYAALDNEIILMDWLTSRLRDVDKPLAVPAEVEDIIVAELLVEKARRRGKEFDPHTDLKWTKPTELFTA